jgi:hypothetical protein
LQKTLTGTERRDLDNGAPGGDTGSRQRMARFEQFEIWEHNGGKWEFVASFKDFDLARAMARKRSYRVRLILAVYQDGKAVEQEVLTEIGATRQEP